METLNILTRTSNRPNGFKRCYNSIKNQTYKKINHIVSCDNEKDLNYLNNYDDIEVIKIYELTRKSICVYRNTKKFFIWKDVDIEKQKQNVNTFKINIKGWF